MNTLWHKYSKMYRIILAAYLVLIGCRDPSIQENISGRVLEVRRVIQNTENTYITFYYGGGDGFIDKVNFYRGAAGDYTINYTYDENRTLVSIKSSCDNVCTRTTFSNEGGKIIHSEKTVNSLVSNNRKYISNYEYNGLDQIISQKDTIIETLNSIPPYDTTVVNILYEYDESGNLHKKTEISELGIITESIYWYDDKINPLQGYYVDLFGEFNLIAKSNPNNLLNSIVYEYSGNYPIKFTRGGFSYNVIYK